MKLAFLVPYLLYAQVVPNAPPDVPPAERIAPLPDDPMSKRLADPTRQIAPSPPPVRPKPPENDQAPPGRR